ncbi:Uncharacterised protein [BD1-7 clade bacterium]|uniref:Uncharacterized protein n=1 Tax=BD1-7 clade bacterium TaxID=2029982 RepID=A0A5S9P788_9GAMM|nr:Uncharacterised protein [BD1-7 clade bacterium]
MKHTIKYLLPLLACSMLLSACIEETPTPEPPAEEAAVWDQSSWDNSNWQ